MKWVLQTGLGADERLFTPIMDLLPSYQFIPQVIPNEGESIEDYALRTAERIACEGPIVLCGISFGGMLSSILCQHLEPRALVLMSSASRPESVAGSARAFEWLSRVLPDTLAAWVRNVGQGAATWAEPMSPEQAESFRQMISKSPLELIRRAGRMIMEWEAPPLITCPRYHLHGARDTLIPCCRVQATQVIPDAGHLLNMTHIDAVREWIRSVRSELERQAPT